MKNGLVVKDNALINASYNLETAEQRLMLLAIMNARETGQGITADSKLEIHASDYAKHFNVSTDAAYKALKDAVNNLFNRQFSYVAEYKKTGKTGIVRSRWVSRVFYVISLNKYHSSPVSTLYACMSFLSHGVKLVKRPKLN